MQHFNFMVNDQPFIEFAFDQVANEKTYEGVVTQSNGKKLCSTMQQRYDAAAKVLNPYLQKVCLIFCVCVSCAFFSSQFMFCFADGYQTKTQDWFWLPRVGQDGTPHGYCPQTRDRATDHAGRLPKVCLCCN